MTALSTISILSALSQLYILHIIARIFFLYYFSTAISTLSPLSTQNQPPLCMSQQSCMLDRSVKNFTHIIHFSLLSTLSSLSQPSLYIYPRQTCILRESGLDIFCPLYYPLNPCHPCTYPNNLVSSSMLDRSVKYYLSTLSTVSSLSTLQNQPSLSQPSLCIFQGFLHPQVYENEG